MPLFLLSFPSFDEFFFNADDVEIAVVDDGCIGDVGHVDWGISVLNRVTFDRWCGCQPALDGIGVCDPGVGDNIQRCLRCDVGVDDIGVGDRTRRGLHRRAVGFGAYRALGFLSSLIGGWSTGVWCLIGDSFVFADERPIIRVGCSDDAWSRAALSGLADERFVIRVGRSDDARSRVAVAEILLRI